MRCRNADVLVLRQVHEKAPGQRNLGGKARAFGVDWIFNYLNQHRLAFKQHVLDALGFFRILTLLQHVDDVQKSRPLQADVDKSALHAGQHAPHHAQYDIAH